MKQLKKKAIGFGKGVVALSVGSQVVGGIGGSVAAKGQAGMVGIAGAFPKVGTIIGVGLTIGALKELEKAGKTIKRKRR